MWTRSVSLVVLCAQVVVALLGIAWWATNLTTLPAYGDTVQYLRLAESLRVDEYRTLFYPLVLRGLKTVAMVCGCRLELVANFVQSILALASVAYLGAALWDVTAATERYCSLRRASVLRRQAVIGTFTILVFSQPLVNHFALSVMTDSLAASFTVAGIGSLIRITALDDIRPRTVVIGWLAIAAAGFMRSEKVYVMGLTVVLAMLAVWWLARPTANREPNPVLSRRRSLLVVLTVLLLTPGGLVTVINKATQTADYYGWPPVSINVRLFLRTVWPRLTELRPFLSQEFQHAVSERDAWAFDADYNKHLGLVPELRRHAGGTDLLVNEASWMAIQRHGLEIAGRTAMDMLKYTIPMIVYPLDLALDDHDAREKLRSTIPVIANPLLVLRGRNASSWTHTRMREARPLLTDIYLWVATGVLIIIQLPVVWLLRRRFRESGWDKPVVVTAGLMLGVSIINAALYSVANGAQNVRFALPACVLVYAVIVWANLTWLAARSVLTDRDGLTGDSLRGSVLTSQR